MGVTTITLIVGGTAYAIKKSYDRKKQEAEAISVDEARAMVKEHESDEEVDEEPQSEPVATTRPAPINMENFKDNIRDVASFNASFAPPSPQVAPINEEFEEFEEDIDEETAEAEVSATDDGYGFYDDVNFDIPLAEYMTEEDKVLRHEPNSIQARQQYLKMELAEWVPMEDAYQTLLKLYDFPFVPQNDGDHMLMTKIIDYRSQFFGFNSKWTKEVDFADIVLYFAKMADYNCGNGIRYWVDYILDHNEFHHTFGSARLGNVLEELNAHTYYNEEKQTYGLFGLSSEGMESAIATASRNIDKSVTYEIEFNELLKTCI